MSQRHRARRLVLQGLCCLDAQGTDAWNLVELFIEDSRESANIISTAKQLLNEAVNDKSECDSLLLRHARNWELGRLAMVDRNILRLAVHELRNSDLSKKIVISEAIQLAKEFSTAESPKFVNGVLSSVAKEIDKDSGD